MNNLYQQWVDTLQSANIKPLADDTCCKLLAIISVFGGEKEAVILNTKLHTDILYAQKRLNLFGGEIPNAELIPLLQQYIHELEPDKTRIERTKPLWAIELLEKYGVKL